MAPGLRGTLDATSPPFQGEDGWGLLCVGLQERRILHQPDEFGAVAAVVTAAAGFGEGFDLGPGHVRTIGAVAEFLAEGGDGGGELGVGAGGGDVFINHIGGDGLFYKKADAFAGQFLAHF